MTIPSWLIRHAVAPLWAWQEGSPHVAVARRLEREQALSADERRARQWQQLQDVVKYAAVRVPHYRRSFHTAGFEVGDLREWADLERLPLLTKSAILDAGAELLANPAPPGPDHPKKTSGSTGISLQIRVDDQAWNWARGVTLFRDQWTGWRVGDWRALVWGNPELRSDWRGRLRNGLLERCFYLDTLRMDEPMMRAFAEEIQARRPTLLFGHAHSLALFARFWKSENLPRYRFRGVLSSAMVLHAHEREDISAAFECGVFDRYGCEEVSLIASECEAHDGLHVNMDSLVVELVGSDGRAVPPGEEGAIVVTDLRNRAMPFVRYRVEDVALARAGACACGRSYPRLARVAGRVADYLLTPDGHLVSGISLTENFATLLHGVRQIQIVQDESDHLLLRIAPGPGFDDGSRRRAAELVATRFGSSMRHTIELVDRIEPESSGKYRFAIRRVGAERDPGPPP
ncbi:MAG: phenylacetate--CoA ligase family protein [Acidobacteria bacterium]|jgi:phenylacetate-CoA ligase|nr:phenylacetate--CoA ligase family protein [Acidobacteriota bacterium]